MVDVIERIVDLNEGLYRRCTRILVHFLDFSMIHSAERSFDRGDRMIRFDINELMHNLRDLKNTGDGDAYNELLENLRNIEEAQSVDLSE